MKLRVRNFGPIRKADVDIKPLTVFAGASNTGKSYLAVLIYSIVKTLHSFSGSDMFAHFDKARHAARGKSWAEFVKSPRRFRAAVAEAMPVFAKAFRAAWVSEAKRCFGAEWNSIIKTKGKLPTSVSVVYGNGAVLDLLNPQNDKFPNTAQIADNVRKRMEKPTMSGFIVTVDGAKVPDSGEVWVCAQETSGRFLSALRGGSTPAIVGSHYLPASRGGIMQSHRTITSTVIEKAPEIGLVGSKQIIPFTGVLADFLKKLILIGDERLYMHTFLSQEKEISKEIGEQGSLPRQMEEGILHGEILVEKSEAGYPDFRYRFKDTSNRKRDIPLMSASSSVSELAPIALFMRYHLSCGDVFIVEEPEAHLHPAAQREIAEVLVRLVKAGVYVVVTTHSDVIQEQISHFIHADGFPEAKVLNKKSAGRTLKKEQVAAYFFARQKQEQGTVIREIQYNKDTGILAPDHQDVPADLYNEFAGIVDAQKND